MVPDEKGAKSTALTAGEILPQAALQPRSESSGHRENYFRIALKRSTPKIPCLTSDSATFYPGLLGYATFGAGDEKNIQ